jgi:hypothetical protein
MKTNFFKKEAKKAVESVAMFAMSNEEMKNVNGGIELRARRLPDGSWEIVIMD